MNDPPVTQNVLGPLQECFKVQSIPVPVFERESNETREEPGQSLVVLCPSLDPPSIHLIKMLNSVSDEAL